MGKGNEHSGHRQRMKKKFLQNGLDVFETHEALELYLYYAIPRRDTNPLAHRLLDRYATIGGVCDAPIDELINDFGLSENTAILIKMLPKMSKCYIESKAGSGNIIDPDDLDGMFRDRFSSCNGSAFALVLGDAKGKMIYFGVISENLSSFSEVPLRKIVDLSLRHHARYVFVGYKCLGGSVELSENDIKTAETVRSVLKNVGVSLVDCYIAADDKCISMRHKSRRGSEVFADNN